MVCRHCGYQNSTSAVYCSGCGKKIAGNNQKGIYIIVALVLVVGVLVGMLISGKQEPTPAQAAAPAPQSSAGSNTTTQQKNEVASAGKSSSDLDNGNFEYDWDPVVEEPVIEYVYEDDVTIQDVRPIAIDGGEKHSVILYSDGTVTTIGDDTYGQKSTSGWRDIVQVSTFANHTVGVTATGTVVAVGNNNQGQCDVSGWTNIVAVAAGSQHTVGVCSDGTVVATGANNAGQCDVQDWENVVSVYANNSTTFGLTSDGRVLFSGSFYHRSMKSWSDIAALSVSSNHVVALHYDGSVSAVGANDYGQCDALEKKLDTLQVAVGYGYTAGLRETGKVWVNGSDKYNQHAAMQWTDIVYIGTGTEHILGIKSDGTLVAKGTNDDGQCNVKQLGISKKLAFKGIIWYNRATGGRERCKSDFGTKVYV